MEILRRLHQVIRSRLSSPPQDNDSYLFESYEQNRSKEKESIDEDDKKTEERLDPLLAQWYSNLEIPYGSDLKSTKQAWRSLMKRYHPDLHSNDPEKKEIATELTRKLTEAYEGIEQSLLDAKKG